MCGSAKITDAIIGCRAVEASLSLPDTGVQEQSYIFLKKMVQILVELGSQVCAVWNSKDTKMLTRAPDNFDTYLQAMLAFSRHPSIMVNFYANNLWGQLSRHPDAKMDPKFLAIVPKWLEVACKKLVKVQQTINAKITFIFFDNTF